MPAGFITSFIIPLILSLIITPWVIKFALQINAVDNPGGRKIHTSVTPRLGGLAVFSSVVVSVGFIFVLFPELAAPIEAVAWQTYIILFCFLSIFLLGFWDDLNSLKPGIKFGIQFIIAAAVYFAGFKISNITNPVGSGMLNVEMIDFPLTLLWIVGITNAFNLIDGLDGLASGVATIASISIFTVSALEGEFLIAMLALTMAGALVGFLRYNFSPAKIFLGDSGSLFIGFSMALMSIQSTTKTSTGFALLFPMLVLGFPITDTLISMLRRFLGSYMPERSMGKSKSLAGKIHEMFTPDSSHIHHQLLSLGLTHRNTVLLLYFVSAFFALGAFAVTQVQNFEVLLIIGLLVGLVIFHGLKKLRYREIAIFNNGMMLPIYEKWILNRVLFLGLIDLVFVAASYTLSYKLLYGINPSSVQFLNFEQVLIMVIFVQLFTFWITGLYREKIKQ
ncbi:MAG TPA: MraY family glycosyltransferase, partial [Balneolaceae bacterium]|nr:MraY family glycosyltransferase [Balneolaceae bacterium]